MQREDTAMVHEGRNVKRIREMLGVKQEALVMDLGISQQAVSALEQKEALDKEMLEKIANALKVTPEAIKSFSEDNVSIFFQTLTAIMHHQSITISIRLKNMLNRLKRTKSCMKHY